MAAEQLVPYIERLAISNALRARLAELTPAGKKKWSQLAIGQGLDVSQEAARRALHQKGVGPKVRENAPAFFGMTMEQLIELYGHEQPAVEAVFNQALGELVLTGAAAADDYKRAREMVSIEGLDDPDKLTVSMAKEMIVAMLNPAPLLEEEPEPPRRNKKK